MRAKASSRDLVWLVLIALAAMGGAKATATEQPKGQRMRINPSTGKPIVQPGVTQLSTDQLRALVVKHGFPDVEKAIAIANRESGRFVDVVVDTLGMTPEQLKAYWNEPAAPELSVGLWQINVHANPQFDAEAMKDPDANAAAAVALGRQSEAAGLGFWHPWGG